MSLETEIQNLTAAVENLAFIIKQLNVTQNTSSKTTQEMGKEAHDRNVYAPLRTDAEVKKTVKDVVKEAAAIVGVPEAVAMGSVQSGAVQMPSLPSFIPQAPAAPVAQTTQSKAPFSDPKGLMTYVMSSYQALGPEKGAQIQVVLNGLGYQNINDIKPEHYDALFAGVEALK